MPPPCRVDCRPPRRRCPRRSTLTLVDLAGSERLKKSNAAGAELKEALAIGPGPAVAGVLEWVVGF